ncbi:MAG: DUF1641 domain-containing protein [Bacteroidales bacterium]
MRAMNSKEMKKTMGFLMTFIKKMNNESNTKQTTDK